MPPRSDKEEPVQSWVLVMQASWEFFSEDDETLSYFFKGTIAGEYGVALHNQAALGCQL